MLRGSSSQEGRVAAGQAPGCAPRRRPEPGNPGGRPRGPGRCGRRWPPARCSPAASTARVSQAAIARVAEQEPRPGLQIGAELAEAADGDSRPIARFGDLRLGLGGFGARVKVSELRARGRDGRRRAGLRPAMSPRRSSITLRTLCAAAVYPCAPRSRAMARAASASAAASASPGRQPSGCGRAAGTARPGPGCSPAPGGPRPRRISSASPSWRRSTRAAASASNGWTWRASAEIPVPCRAASAQQLKAVADLAVVPADDCAGDHGRHDGVHVVLARGGQDGIGGLGLRGRRAARPGPAGARTEPGPAGRQAAAAGPGPAGPGRRRPWPAWRAHRTEDRAHPQPVLGRRRQRLGQQVTGDAGGLIPVGLPRPGLRRRPPRGTAHPDRP